MARQFATVLATGKPQDTEPSSCKGLSPSTLAAIAAQILAGH
jgi:hypothetical protein